MAGKHFSAHEVSCGQEISMEDTARIFKVTRSLLYFVANTFQGVASTLHVVALVVEYLACGLKL
jgi:hypothetical protein